MVDLDDEARFARGQVNLHIIMARFINTFKSYRRVALNCGASPNAVKNLVLGLQEEEKAKPWPKPVIIRRKRLNIKRKAEGFHKAD